MKRTSKYINRRDFVASPIAKRNRASADCPPDLRSSYVPAGPVRVSAEYKLSTSAVFSAVYVYKRESS